MGFKPHGLFYILVGFKATWIIFNLHGIKIAWIGLNLHGIQLYGWVKILVLKYRLVKIFVGLKSYAFV